MSGTRANVIVSDPGRRADFFYAAKGLAAAGDLRLYATPIAFRPDGRLVNSSSTNPLLGGLQHFAKLRALPAEIEPSRVLRIGAAYELYMFAARKFRPLRRSALGAMNRRNRSFERRVGNAIQSDDGLVFASFTAAEQTFRDAADKGVSTLLSYPIAHHRWAQEILAEEAELQPEFAPTLQFVDVRAEVIDQIEREIELADHVHCLCDFHARTMVAAGLPQEKLVTAQLGVDLELFTPATRVPRGGGRPLRIIFVGQITQRKGLSYLIEGFERAAIPGSELLLVGNPIGPVDAWINRPGVRHVAHVPRSELPALYATADLFVMPSLVEGFCLTALEALACGVPVAATANTFVGDELLRDGAAGWTLPLRDADAIADCITRIAESAFDWDAMSRAARERAEQYGWSRYERQIAATIRELATRKESIQ